eukprot:8851672-Pyramimonas_sp.AAC.1
MSRAVQAAHEQRRETIARTANEMCDAVTGASASETRVAEKLRDVEVHAMNLNSLPHETTRRFVQ